MIREGSPFAATVSQPFELYVHTVFEVINQVESELIRETRFIGSPSRVIYKTPIVTDETTFPIRELQFMRSLIITVVILMIPMHGTTGRMPADRI